MTLAFVKIFFVAFCLPSVEPLTIYWPFPTLPASITSTPGRYYESTEPQPEYQQNGQEAEVGHKDNQGLRGQKGNEGQPGTKGVKGDKGERGPTGTKGARGPGGAPGVIGPQGLPGRFGQQGPPGNTGYEGPEGPHGVPGPRGPTGKMGSKGIQGIKGARGFSGLSGHHGNHGPPGYKGREGRKGVKGIKGDTGLAGHKGEQGRQGIPGAIANEERLETHLGNYLEAYLTKKVNARFAKLTQSLNNHPAAHLYGNNFHGNRLTWMRGRFGGFVDNGMSYNDGYLIVPKKGLYYIYAQVKCDPVPKTCWCGFSFRINDSEISQQFISQHRIAQDVLYYNVPEAGLLRKLNKGDRISVTKRGSAQIFGQDHQTYFGCYAISTFDS